MSEIDWSKAPEGTTHRFQGNRYHYWMRETSSGTGWEFWNGVNLEWQEDFDPAPELHTPRPVEPQEAITWNGEGLPPVGTVCDALVPGKDFWRMVKVVYVGEPGSKNEALVFDMHDTKPAWCDEFRPIRTAEQIAAEKRDAEINEMIRCVKNHPNGLDGVSHLAELKIQEDACCDLHAAGYRKQEES